MVVTEGIEASNSHSESQPHSNKTSGRKLGFPERAFSAAGAAFLSAILVNPLDVAKTRLQAQAAGVPYSHPLSNVTSRMAFFGPNMPRAEKNPGSALVQKATLKPIIIVSIILVRFLILPIVGIGVERLATNFGLLPSDPLFHFVLMVQFTLPPAMNIGTMTQLFDVGQAECSVIFLWTYVVAALALTVWSTVYMWILS